ncbi:MAG: ATP synthase F0 subunit A [Bacteroidetes bacterium QH_2_63_10]|nr:MAG: ATP synthase F0 subunit A [Bacteroidetes bacterium QH_2_63_10]
MIARLRSFGLAALLLLGMSPILMATSATAAAEEDGVTLESIVNNSILGHATDGYYLSFGPQKVELPRIMLVRTADGSLSLEAYANTKSLLKHGPYGLAPHGDGHEGPVTEPSKLKEAIAAKEYLHRSVVRAEGHVVADFSISRHFVFGLLAMVIVFGVFITLAQRYYKKGIGRTEAPRGIFQNMMEVMVVFVRDEIAKPNIPGEKWRTFLPYLLTAFFFILVANILGLVPFAGAATSNIAVTGVMAVMTFVIVLLYSSKDYYKELFTGPPDAPTPVRVIFVPIEIIGLVMRHLALAIRLFANMVGGALIIFSLLGLIFIIDILFGEVAAVGTVVISIAFTVFILLLKLLVAFIQAYVFTILSALFIGMAVEEHHHEEDHDADTAPDTSRIDERLDAVEEAVEPTSA